MRRSSRTASVAPPVSAPALPGLRCLLGLVAFWLVGAAPLPAGAQTARISEEARTLATYPFSEPDPVPILARDARLYPYHSFEGYSHDAEPRDWTVVRLENDYIEVFVLPQAGGKVWGARVKATGDEFIYRNEVMKFRNIALRGPWTSGGIEFNFGVIGHTPATATPVDHVLRENDDGSVSCIVGAMDLPSRTHWRVEIRLPAAAAYFETNVVWYNPTPLTQPYYNWMTAAAFARPDLEMFMPGDAYLEHSGAVRDWPLDEQGRNLALYRNNDFGGSKSYHVVGELDDFFGGYYHDDGWGFGHWAPHEDMPGRKLWIWALSRAGGIWEDLLTDTDGQYIEFQAGRLLVQYQPGSDVNPITQAGFDPMSTSRWSETWFPLVGIGGLSAASREGALHARHDGDELTVSVNSFVAVDDRLEILARDAVVASMPLRLTPLAQYRTTMALPAGTAFRVRVPALDLDYTSDPSERRLARPFTTDPDAYASLPEVDRMGMEARERYEGRRHDEARALFESALTDEPFNRDALLGLGELGYRAGRYEAGLQHVHKALQLDAYDAEANFLAGILYRALGRSVDARDAFGWAARATGFRAAAYAQLAEITLQQQDLAAAERYARRALDYDRTSVPAWRALAVASRLRGDGDAGERARGELLTLDPLHHFVFAERYLEARDADAARELTDRLGGEYPEQTLLELIVGYAAIGRNQDALALLALANASSAAAGARPLRRAWGAFLSDDASLLTAPGDPSFVFPFRRESLAVLAWASERSDSWVWRYLYGLNLWAVGRSEEAAELFAALGDTPDYAPFYVARAQLREHVARADDPGGVDSRGRESPAIDPSRDSLSVPVEPATPTADYRRAVALDPQVRVLHVYLARHLAAAGRHEEALGVLTAARSRFPDDFNLALLDAGSLVELGRAAAALAILENVRVLPSEHSGRSHTLWEQAHVMAALDAFEAGDHDVSAAHLEAAMEWPESLGQGRPYDPDERLPRYLLARVEQARGNDPAARDQYEAVATASGAAESPGRRDLLLLGVLAQLEPERLRSMLERNPVDAEVARVWQRFAEAGSQGTLENARRRWRDIAAEHPELFADVEGRLILRALTARAGR